MIVVSAVDIFLKYTSYSSSISRIDLLLSRISSSSTFKCRLFKGLSQIAPRTLAASKKSHLSLIILLTVRAPD